MHKVYFATNRDIKTEDGQLTGFGGRFNADGPQVYRVGMANVSGRKATTDKGWKVKSRALMEEDMERNILGSSALFEDLRKTLKDGCDKDIIVYLHGFANGFNNSAIRAAQLQALYGGEDKSAIVFFFAWPSNGKVFPSYSNYMSDRDDAKMSGIAMGRALKRLFDFLADMRREDRKTIHAAMTEGEVPSPENLKECSRKIHMVAHSMGNWALRHAVEGFAAAHGGLRLPRIFEHIFLMAADEDADALGDKTKLGRLLELGEQIHVYHARDDQPLQVSDKTKGNPDRLGANGPSDLEQLDPRVMTIDCQDVSATDFAHGKHQYYRIRPEVISDVVATLAGRPQEGRKNRNNVRPGRSWRIIKKKEA